MIEQLRYYMSGDRVLVKWNWVGNDNAVATCRMFKRLGADHEELDRRDNISIEAYLKGGQGCEISAPKIPAIVEVTDNQGGCASIVIHEAPPYPVEITPRIEMRDLKSGLLGLKREKKSYLQIECRLPDSISSKEIDDIEGWVFAGRHRHDSELFFLPRVQGKVTHSVMMEVDSSFNRKDFNFEVVPETKGTKFEGMFCVNPSGGTSRNAGSVEGSLVEIDLSKLKPEERDPNHAGMWRITCPYCFNKFSFDEPVFRAVVYESQEGFGDLDNEFAIQTFGHRSEVDQQYKKFNEAYGLEGGNEVRGHVLEWTEIRSLRYASAPDIPVSYKAGDPLEDVVVAVTDEFGNTTSEKLCPRCHHVIPIKAGKYPMLFVNMVGYTGTGKTVYMASVINRVESGALLPGYRFRCSVCDNLRAREVRSNFKAIQGQTREEDQPASDVIGEPQDISPIQDIRRPVDDEFSLTLEEKDPFSSNNTPSAPLHPVEDAQFAARDPYSIDIDGDLDDDLDDLDNLDSEPNTPLANTPLRMVSTAETMRLASTPAPILENLFEESFDNSEDWKSSKNSEPRATQLPIGDTIRYTEPCIYTLDNTDDEGIILSFFDMPGEATITEEGRRLTSFDRILNRQINMADGLIFMFDPSSMHRLRTLPEDLRNEFVEHTMKGVAEGKWDTVRNREWSTILEGFKRKFMQGEYARLNKPVAMVVSKSDAIRDFLRQKDPDIASEDTFFLDETVFSHDTTRKRINVSELKRASSAIETFLQDSELRAICSHLMVNLEDLLWVCISSTGMSPDENNTMYQRHGNPQHVLDPLEWIIYRSYSDSVNRQANG